MAALALRTEGWMAMMWLYLAIACYFVALIAVCIIDPCNLAGEDR